MSDYFEFRLTERKQNMVYNKKADVNIFDKSNCLQLLKREILSSKNLCFEDKTCYDDEQFLNRFLYARDFNLESTMKLFINYMSFKKNNIRWLKNMSIFDNKIQMSLQDGNPRILKQRDRKGNKILTFAASNWDSSKYSMIDIFRALLISVDKLLENVQNQALGFVVIVDWTGFSLKQSMNLNPKTLKLITESLQYCIPAKFNGIHFISQSWYIDLLSTAIKSNLSDKVRKKLVIHGTNLATLHEYVHKDVLPPDLGGEGPHTTTLDWYHYLLQSSQSDDCLPSYRLIEATVYSKIPYAKS